MPSKPIHTLKENRTPKESRMLKASHTPKEKTLRMMPAYEVFNSSPRTQRNHVRDGYFFATKLQTWFVFVEDKGEQEKVREETQLDLFG